MIMLQPPEVTGLVVVTPTVKIKNHEFILQINNHPSALSSTPPHFKYFKIE